ncbi:PREDICTED: uncharacterized protein K02A2.6-like [Vollenhovia emeryi]|uniref:uncharacterized protein K02A2.6-like n=1 Tax=Vollenhovia emeryi TaxID=411798 RepID=UPI0005F522FF|nr:PREDICTED: uncharacterized protein K02A2.6-like [Vollenhovia emeryi]
MTHVDFAGPFMGHTFFILVDAFSKWPVVYVVKDMSTAHTISVLNEILATFGYRKMLVSDNGRTFIATEFKEFLEKRGIKQKLTAPYHPATSSQAERFVHMLKQALKRKSGTGSNVRKSLQEMLMQYRSMPYTTTAEEVEKESFDSYGPTEEVIETPVQGTDMNNQAEDGPQVLPNIPILDNARMREQTEIPSMRRSSRLRKPPKRLA